MFSWSNIRICLVDCFSSSLYTELLLTMSNPRLYIFSARLYFVLLKYVVPFSFRAVLSLIRSSTSSYSYEDLGYVPEIM